MGRGARPGGHRHPPRPAGRWARRGRLFRGRRVDEREGIRVRQVRAGRARHRHDRLQRPVLHVVGRDCVQSGLRHRPRAAVPAGRHRRGRGDPADRLQPRSNHAARHAVVRCRPGGRRHPHRGRSPADGNRGRLVDPPLPAAGYRPRAGQRSVAPGDQGRPDRLRLHRRSHQRIRCCTSRRGRVLAGPRRADHRRTGGAAPRNRAHPRPSPDGDDPHRPRHRTAQQRHRHHAGLDQPRPGAGTGRQAVLRIRHDHRAGQRPGWSRARPEGRPAARLSQARRSGRPGSRSGGLGDRPRRTAPAWSFGLRAAGPAGPAGRRTRSSG